MKILFVSMHSIHAVRWIQNLSETEHELYWFDILNQGELKELSNINQIINWAKRKIPPIKGEYFLSKKAPELYLKIQSYLEVTANEKLEKIIKEIKPDVVHSFEMNGCSFPILKTMQKYPELKWVYSCWGSDLFYFQNFRKFQKRISKALERIDFLHTDCKRDYDIAVKLGFKGKHVGVIPGGGGYNMIKYESFIKPYRNRKIILVKGYQHVFGRALKVIEALQNIEDELHEFEIVVFGAHKEVLEYVEENNLPFLVHLKETISHTMIMQLMGKSAIYIGNSVSDGMPNTLLEAMFMGAFPIQSNPGGVTEEIIEDFKNGVLIEKPEDINSIKEIILKVVKAVQMQENAFTQNQLLAKEYLDYHLNQQKISRIYDELIK